MLCWCSSCLVGAVLAWLVQFLLGWCSSCLVGGCAFYVSTQEKLEVFLLFF